MLNLIIHNQSEDQKKAVDVIASENIRILEEAKTGENCYADSQGWLDTEEWAGEENIKRLEEIAKEIRENADAFVLIGVGGSNNAARSVIEALSKDDAPEIIYAGNTLSPDAMNRMMKRLEGKSIYIDCIAKNFETLEPGSSFRILRKYMEKTYGEEAGKRIIATGTVGSSLETLCTKYGYTFLEFPLNVGGRYTAMTNVGLLPMAVAGIDISELVKGARDMQIRVHEESAEKNIAYQYACLRNLYYKEGYRVEMLSSFEPQFRFFYKWWIQLFAESEGKFLGNAPYLTGCGGLDELYAVLRGESFTDIADKFGGIVSVTYSPAMIQTAIQDMVDYLDGKDFWEINKAAYHATVAAHSKKLPCLTIEVDELDAYHFGQLFYFFQFACYLSCKIMGVNPFDQPGVEAYKKWMFEALGK